MRNADVSRKTLLNSLGASHTVSIIVLLFATRSYHHSIYIQHVLTSSSSDVNASHVDLRQFVFAQRSVDVRGGFGKAQSVIIN